MKDGLILLIEDNEDDVALTLDAFAQCKLADRVIVARTGAAAIEFLYKHSEPSPTGARAPVSLVLLDLKLPMVGGLDVLKQIRSDPATRRLPVVVLTSSREEQDVHACYELGVNSYIRKPVNFDEFVKATKDLANYWLLLNESAP